jgi:hypothetical protein
MRKVALAATIILSPLFYNTALGCACNYQPNPTAEEIRVARLKAFDSAVAVFSGKVIELDENKVKFKVEKIWKGASADEITMVIQEGEDNGEYVMTSCDYSYKLGEKYLVYADSTHDELRTSVCSRTVLLRNADQEMRGLDEIRIPEIRNTEGVAVAVIAKSNKRMQRTRKSASPLSIMTCARR